MALPNINDIVTYGTSGVCEVTEIKEMDLMGNISEYFVLKPISDNKSTVFLPADNAELMERVRPVLTAKEVHSFIDSIEDVSGIWIDNDAMRKRRYSEILGSGEREEVMGVIKTLYALKMEREALGKKLRSSDEAFLKDAQKQLFGEFAYVLGIPSEEIAAFVMERLECGLLSDNE